MEQYLIDTNVISDYLSDSFPEKAALYMDGVIDAIPNISIITQIELLCWNTNPKIEENLKDFLLDSRILNINPSIVEHCVAIRKGKKIKTPDAIIAATALAYNYMLITNNIMDFDAIQGRKLINPHIL